RAGQPSLLALGEAFAPRAEDVADAVEGIALAPSVAEGLLLDPAADVVDCCRAELDDVEGVQHAGRIFELVIDRVLVSLEWVQRRDLDAFAERLAPLVQPVSVGLARSAGDEVAESGGGVGSAGQVDHPGELLRRSDEHTSDLQSRVD